MFVRQIIENLTSNGILNNGKPFATNTIYNILHNEIYTGRYVKDNEIFTNMYPRIISDELYNKVKEKHKANRYGKQSIKSVYLFKNKLICGYCGKPISAESGTTKHGKKINYYKCSGRKKFRNNCIKETIRQEILEDFLLNAIISEIEKPQTIDIIVKHLMKLQKDCTNTDSTISILKKQKKQAETKLNNIVEALTEGIRNSTTNKKMEELENTINELEKQILIEQSKVSVDITEDEIRKYYTKALKEEPIIIINYLVKNIVLYNDKVEITFNSPITKSPDKQGFLILSKIIKMRKIIQNKKEDIYIDLEVKYLV